MDNNITHHKAIIIGASAGCLDALSKILPLLPADYPYPIMVVVHLPSDKDSLMAKLLNEKCTLTVQEAEDKDPLMAGHVYIAPPNYHLLVEKEEIISLSIEEEVNYSRPSIDVSFLSAADIYGSRLIGIILTGANNDGAEGLAAIAAKGGTTIVQDPDEAYIATMPESALTACPDARIMNLFNITEYLRMQAQHV